jgi:hypothetical protein
MVIIDTYKFKETSKYTDLIAKYYNFSSPGLVALVFIMPILFSFAFSMQTWLNSNEHWLVRHLSYEHTLMIFIFPIVNYFAIKKYLQPLIMKYRSSKWLSATAVISDIKIMEISIPHRGYREVVYLPNIKYEFSVDDDSYTGNRYSFEAHKALNEMLGSSDETDNRFEKYVNEKKIEIFYDPQNPNSSVIIKTLQPYSKVLYVQMVLLVSLGIISNIMCTIAWLQAI